MLRFLRENIVTFFCILLLFLVFLYLSPITRYLSRMIENDFEVSIPQPKEYMKTDEFHFVSQTDHFIPYSVGDIKNIFYTIVNSGWEDFTFYCPSEYTNCLNDMKAFSKNQDLLTHINNFVHPFHSFSNVKTVLAESGEVKIHVEYLYTPEQIVAISSAIDELIAKEISFDDSLYDQIKTFHDYIINHTKYDVTRNETNDSTYLSYIAYGPLFQGYATCNGYTDVMAIFLNRLGIPNYKIATTKSDLESEGHVWNAVYYEGKWVHLDLTWDDPVGKDGKDYLQHKYFLVDNEDLKEADSGEVEVLEHTYPSNIYLEFQE